ncbi:MAG: hypothetical protein COU63_04970 [Candidatus Pacebacteria bacterium CG10_big_fil_rev_8_21_14_0_10_36_11]|nr:hypothetical protein [Candidatus Pacearchaeota archaeon]OIP73823.1 MAG: hypothetical protein AUK08_04680 [Candidatus Pacebacteria bacterium CG2_30_36_39]PIR64289.1 MAG: hypothetical protein COU63_04970 [Candidatus Pacebacteria bacterium CG10_big_fil_rev_8_21_14_0_10_36_11]PJC42686.1 MAG: hypothetical protein CO040_03185 [Candidatus Pacebacteria bacterium CG_4_9_14_0_2_um_filter_36_8]
MMHFINQLKNQLMDFFQSKKTLMKYLKKINFYFKKFQTIVNFLISFISLLFTYIVGIGITSLVAKIVGKKFLGKKATDSQWVAVDYSDKFNQKMS